MCNSTQIDSLRHKKRRPCRNTDGAMNQQIGKFVTNDITPLATSGESGPETTSLIVAEGTGVQHKNVLELIRNNLADFEEFGRVAFETRPRPQGQHGGADVSFARLNEEQATLLLTYMRNSDIVRQFKKNLVRAFYELRKNATVVAQLPDRRALAQMVIEAEDRAAALEAPARSWELLADAKGDFSVAESAKILSRDPSITTGRDRLFAYMADRKWIFKSRNARGGWEAYQTAVDTRRLVERPAKPFLNSKTGAYELPAPTIRVTAKGIGKLHELMGGTKPIRFVVGEAS